VDLHLPLPEDDVSDDHSCPVCRCKWTPSGPYAEGKTQSEAIFNNVQRMAREIRVLNQALARRKK
jgi:hypothetical protein